MLRSLRATSNERGFKAFADRVGHKVNPGPDLRRVWDATFKSHRFNPTEVWQVVTDITCDNHYGTGKHADKTGETYQWFRNFVDRFGEAHIDAPAAANFILEGRHVLLDNYRRDDICDQQKATLGEFYIDLVNDEAMKEGWNHIYRSTFIPDLMQGSSSTLMTDLITGLSDSKYGVAAIQPIMDGSKHIFVTEFENFVKSDVVQHLDPSIRNLVVQQAQQVLLPKLHTTNSVISLEQAYKDIYVTTVANASEGYGAAEANRITLSYDSTTTINPDVQMASVRQTTSTTMDQLEKLLTDPAVGVGGKDEQLTQSTIKLFNDTVTAISKRHALIQGVFFETVTDRLLGILETTKHPKIRELYEELVSEKLAEGQKFMAMTRMTPDKAREYVEELLDRTDNQIYGVGGLNMTDTFIAQFETFLTQVGTQTTEVHRAVYEAIKEKIKTQVAEKRDPKKTKVLATYLEKSMAQLGTEFVDGETRYMFDVPEFEQTKAFTDAVAANLESAKDTLGITGVIPAEVVEMVTQQTKQAFLEAPVRQVWQDLIDDLTNEYYGEGSIVGNLAEKFEDIFTKIKAKVKRLSPEKQYLFYKVGKEQILAFLKENNGNMDVNAEVMVEQFNDLVNDKDFDGAREYEKAQLMVQADHEAAMIEKAEGKSEARLQFYTHIWEDYLGNLYDPALKQGAHTDVSQSLKKDFEKLMTDLSTADFEHTGAFLRAGYKEYIKFLREFKETEQSSDDARQRMVFETFALLSHSPIANALLKRENDFADDHRQGAKMVRTLGRIQVEFIMELIDNNNVNLFFQYIETNLKSGQFKDDKEERLCITMLMIYRDVMRKKSAGNITSVDGVEEPIDLGFPPEMETLMSYQNSVIASLESSTKAIEGGHLNALTEVLAVIGDLSPYTLVRLASEPTIGRLLKNRRKFGDVAGEERAKIITIIQNSELTAAEKFYLIYNATGKMYYELDIARQLTKDKDIEIVINGAVQSRDGKDLLEQIFTYRDDVCQVTTVPGLQAILGDNFEEGHKMTALRRSIFETYFATAVYRIKSAKFNEGGQLSQVAATELMALSMLLEKTTGEDESVKNGIFARIYSDLLIDIITSDYGNAGRKYNQAVKDMAWKVLNYSLPYWSTDRVQIFVDSFADRVKTTDLDGWIEGGNWKKLIKTLAVVDRNLLPLSQEGGDKNNIRSAIAKIVIDHTLDLLSVYDVLGGRSSVKSPIDVITGGNSGWPERTNLTIEQEGNFIEQAIGMVSFIGVEEEGEEGIKHRTRLKEILEDLARRDNLRYAWKKDMMPNMPADGFLATSEQMVTSMRDEVLQVQTDFAGLLDSAVKGSRTFIEVDEETGRVVTMVDKPALVQIIEQEGAETLSTLIKQVKLAAKRKQAKSFADKQMIGLESLNGEEFVDLLLGKISGYSGDDKEFKSKFMAVLEKFAEGQGNGEFNAAVEAASRVSVNVEKAAGFGTLAALLSKSSGIAGLQGIMRAYLESDKAFGANLIKELLAKSDYDVTIQEAESIRQAILTGLKQILVDDNLRQEAVMGLRRTEELSYGQDLLLIQALRNKYVTRETQVGEKAMGIEMSAVETELNQLEAEIRANHAARRRIVTEYESALPKAAEKLAKMQRGYSDVAVQNVDGFYQWLRKVSAPNGAIYERTRSYASGIVTSHHKLVLKQSQKKHGEEEDTIQLSIPNMIPTPREILTSMGLYDAYKDQLPATWAA